MRSAAFLASGSDRTDERMSEMIPLSRVNAMSNTLVRGMFRRHRRALPLGRRAAAAERPFTDFEGHDPVLRECGEKRLPRASARRCCAPIPTLPAGPRKSPRTSSREQKGAGLNALSPEEYGRFQMLNETYRNRFGFPFIFAVRGATKHEILEAFQRRIANSAETEFDTALRQVCAILRFRLEDRVAP